MTLLSVGSIL